MFKYIFIRHSRCLMLLEEETPENTDYWVTQMAKFEHGSHLEQVWIKAVEWGCETQWAVWVMDGEIARGETEEATSYLLILQPAGEHLRGLSPFLLLAPWRFAGAHVHAPCAEGYSSWMEMIFFIRMRNLRRRCAAQTDLFFFAHDASWNRIIYGSWWSKYTRRRCSFSSFFFH